MEKSMQLKFDGQTHSIDANTLINALTHYQTVLQEANRQFSNGEKNVTLKVNAIEKGSFVIDISVVQNLVQQLFTGQNIGYIASLITIVGGVYKSYKVLKGKPAKQDELKGVIVNGDVNIITNIYNQPIVREAISKTIEEVDKEPNVDGFSLSSSENPNDKTTFERSEFKEYIYNDFENEGDIPDEKIVEENTTLVIIGLNFEPNSQWQFGYNGIKISMRVKDDALMQKINEGARFGKGDAIKVKLRIIKRYNKEFNFYENKAYKIVEFHEHIIAPTLKRLF